MSAEIIPLPHVRLSPRPRVRLSSDVACRMVRHYEAAIALGFRAELHTALGNHVRAHRCRRAVGRLRRVAFACCLALLPREQLADFTDRILGQASPVGPDLGPCLEHQSVFAAHTGVTKVTPYKGQNQREQARSLQVCP